MATGRIGGGFEYPLPRPRSRPQTIPEVKIEHPTPPHPFPPSPPPVKTLFFIKYLKNAYFFIFSWQQKHNNYINNHLSNKLFSKEQNNYNKYVSKE